MKVLFVCTANALRSRTAEDFLKPYWPQHEILSAGTDLKQCMRSGNVGLTTELLDWADIVLVMEHVHKKRIEDNAVHYLAKVKVLGIPDVYKYGQLQLIDKLIWRSQPHLGEALDPES